jgi:hypothetical protein
MRYLSNSQAEQLWARAAELQEQAKRAAVNNPRDPSVAGTEAQAAVDDQGAFADGVDPEAARQAAVDSGIPASFFDQALLESRAEAMLRTERETRVTRWAARLLQRDALMLTVRRRLHASVDDVAQALEAVSTSQEFPLDLGEAEEEQVPGGETAPAGKGSPAFQRSLLQSCHIVRGVPGMQGGNGMPGSRFVWDVAMVGDVQSFAVSLTPSEDGDTEITIVSPLDHSARVNASWALILSILAGSVLLIGGSALAAAQSAGPVGQVLSSVTAAAASAGGVIGVLKWYRHAYRKAVERIERSYHRLIRAVKGKLTTRS